MSGAVVTIWLLWSTMNGVPVDVDSFLNESGCIAAYTQLQYRIASLQQQAKDAKVPEADLKTIQAAGAYGCFPAQVTFKKKES